MPQYRLNSLGADEFERMVQALLKEVIGSGTITFGTGRDGGREATFSGKAPYPSTTEPWSGEWIFQVKFHNTELVGVDKSRKAIVRELDAELDKIVNKYKLPCDNYILITNVPLSPVAGSGTLDRIERTFSRYRDKIRNCAVWGSDDVSRLLEKYPAIRTAYLHLIVPGDLIAQLLEEKNRSLDETTTTVRSYLQVLLGREENAQLDQAGDVSEEPVRLQEVFFDLDSDVRYLHRSMSSKLLAIAEESYGQGRSGDRVAMARLLISEKVDKVVLVGGPGEGKSTVGQYVAQLHRANLLGRLEEITDDERYFPVLPRIPFRIVLRDFGQWLAERSAHAQPLDADTLDSYIAEHIQKVTARDISVTELHRVIKENPVLFILDGLDEVTDPTLRKRLLERLGEFTTKCESVLKADLQVFATTRPTGYVEQFDPKSYMHFSLARLEPEQVRDYVEKWIVARNLDEGKSSRLRESIGECLADPQIRLLTNTPLQVTILVLIISAGGSPPRQREALFDEYLEVIYKRETAKGRNIIQSEKELLIGLHKYIGYVLHEEATRATAMSAALERPEYIKLVDTFLQAQDPYSPVSVRESELRAITKEAGERLVLIVESPADIFGFELRSIQEFFAACHLTDTSRDTDQRYRRFEAIARTAHWRNVALFFAGRVGRNYPGEAANVIEVCRSIDREGNDRFVRRGSLLALELAGDRAFGPNRRLQRSLLELGLEVLRKSISGLRLSAVTEMLRRLPPEDIRDHVIPVVEQWITDLSPQRLISLVYVMQQVSPGSSLLPRLVRRVAESPAQRIELLRLIMRSDVKPVADVVREIVDQLEDETIGSVCVGPRWLNTASDLNWLADAGVSEEKLNRVIEYTITGLLGIGPTDKHRETIIGKLTDPWPEDVLQTQTHAISILTALVQLGRPSARGQQVVGLDSRAMRRCAEIMPSSIRDGRIDDFAASTGLLEPRLAGAFWLIHLLLGNVDWSSIARFDQYYRERGNENWFQKLMASYPIEISPALDFYHSAQLAGDKDAIEYSRTVLSKYGGLDGAIAWSKARLTTLTRLRGRDIAEPELLLRLDHRTPSRSQAAPAEEVANEVDPQLIDYAALPAVAPRGAGLRLERDQYMFIVKGIRSSKVMTRPKRMLIRRLLSYGRPRVPVEAIDTILAYLLSRRIGSREADLIAWVLTRRLAESVQISERLLDRSLSAVAKVPPTRSVYLPVGNSPQRQRAILSRLLPISTKAGSSRHIRGARLIIQWLASSTTAEVHARPAEPKFKGFTELHRQLLRSTASDARLAGAALFSLRSPSAPEDWTLLGSILLNCSDGSESAVLTESVGVATSFTRTPHKWISFLSSLLERELELRAELAEFLADRLDALLALDNQSLEDQESELELP
ncbi:NACHT domain-containing NTPase [Kribbella sp. VKM Ac-2568]|uniref:NACHT domain-containing protein n=1 Tax=Kribbella sp. VKM Ac-2568 TaxID=2512219 RepID=UPI001052057A|nr:hypothetical protein [Kribbella sp. VKM Ac-2568]TCM46943.1 hypothetical protein EV648_105421 [Kribbella sp. VKM Ac-2568]